MKVLHFCQPCQKAFTNKSEFTKHVINNHKEEEKKEGSSNYNTLNTIIDLSDTVDSPVDSNNEAGFEVESKLRRVCRYWRQGN